ncbi:MAG: tetratricopeptide repeat protein [Deltaproteobacteria bacterium]|nr:tetratricopeptide repeat protein [Deltaproteobacteria bacterium]
MRIAVIPTLIILLVSSRSARVRAEETPGDILRAEADAALAKGDFAHAQLKFDEYLELVPDDAEARRDAGRAGMAAGDFKYAVRVLETAHHYAGHHRDPELHYLRGEGLYELGEFAQAFNEHRIAELEIDSAPNERMRRLWLARIYSRRGQMERADRVYESMWPGSDQPVDAEVAMNHAEAHVMGQDWPGAERVLRRYLDRDPENVRGRLLLAWALESQGNLDAELAVRADLDANASSAAIHQDYGRALERAHDYAHAHIAYEDAVKLTGSPDAALLRARDRMRYRTTPEVGAIAMVRSDRTTSAQHVQAGVALPFGSRHLVSLLGWHDALSGGFPVGRAKATGLAASLVLGTRWTGSLTLTQQIRQISDEPSDSGRPMRIDQGTQFGETVEVDTPLGAHVRLNLRGEFDTLWSDAPNTIQEGGATTGLTGHVFVVPFLTNKNLILDTGAQTRRLRLARLAEENAAPEASQVLMWAGADVVLWRDPTRALLGEILDDNFIRPTAMTDALVLSYRHYELFGQSDADFASRIFLFDRSSIDNGSLVIRNTFLDGRFGLDVHAGLGYDHARERILSQAGLLFLAALSAGTRLGIAYDIVHETANGLPGTRQTGWLTYHADI